MRLKEVKGTFKAKYAGKCAVTGAIFCRSDYIGRNPLGKGYVIGSVLQDIREKQAKEQGSKECKITPQNKEVKDIEYRDYTIRVYRIVAKWNHCRIAYIRRPDGSYLTYEEMRAFGVMFKSDSSSGYTRSNLSTSLDESARYVYDDIDAEIDGVESKRARVERYKKMRREMSDATFYALYPEIKKYHGMLDAYPENIVDDWSG